MDATFWALMPPVVAIVLALITKEVYVSLLIGILAGGLFYANFNVLDALETTFTIMGERVGSNTNIIVFLVLLGMLVALMSKSGASRAYGSWASRSIKTKRGALFATAGLGALIFVDDYFNCLTVGTVMRPVTERYKISKAKLAYIIEGVKEFRTMHAVPLEIEADGERFDLRSLMVLIFNGETAGGFHLARRSSIKDGLFDCILLEKKNFFRSTLAMCRYLAGGSPKIVRHLRARRIDIRSSVNEPTDVDGQKGAEFPLHIECLAGGLRVMCAKQASDNS